MGSKESTAVESVIGGHKDRFIEHTDTRAKIRLVVIFESTVALP